MIDRLSGRLALLVVVVATLAIVLLGWFVLLAPERSKAAKLDSQIGDTNSQLQSVSNLLNGPVGRQSLVTSRLFDRALPAQTKMSQILRQLSTAASASGVELDSITPGALLPGAGTETLPISVSVRGHYFGLQKFLRLVRSAADLSGDQVRATGRLYTVDSIQFSGGGVPQTGSSGGSGGSSIINGTLALNAFLYDPSSVAAAPAAPATPTTTTDTSTTTASP
jgi:type IV pilus assembly PilO-like protein